MYEQQNYLLTASINGVSAIYKMAFDTKDALLERIRELEQFCTINKFDFEATAYQLMTIVKSSKINNK